MASRSQKMSVEEANGQLPDLTGLMNDWFFGSTKRVSRAHNLMDYDAGIRDDDRHKYKKNTTSKLTQEWLEEAKRMVANSPSRHSSPSKLVGSPRFAALSQGSQSPGLGDTRDPRSRSARRQRSSSIGVGDEILLRSSGRYSRSNSDASLIPPDNSSDSAATDLPPRPLNRKSRFHDTAVEPPCGSNPSISAVAVGKLSPPRAFTKSAHRRSISSSTCSIDESGRRRPTISISNPKQLISNSSDVRQINSFLQLQREMILKITAGEVSAKTKIILSGSSCSITSSMVAAICYSWLLENTKGKDGIVVVPVLNLSRERMHNDKQAAWLFQHVGIDASLLLFSNEVDLEGLIMSRQLSICTIGQDVLKTNNEVGSQCTLLTDHYCEDAYDLLQNASLKKLLLAGILLDTHNLNDIAKFSRNRDMEAARLLLVNFAPNYRNEFYEQLMLEHNDPLLPDYTRQNYKKLSNEDSTEDGASQDSSIPQESRAYGVTSPSPASHASQQVKIPNSGRQKQRASPAPVLAKTPAAPLPASQSASNGKSKFSLAKWFGFGSK